MSAPPTLPDATRLALDRTRMAGDRTLLAWVRTSTSLISFGFTIYKFFQYLRESQKVEPAGLLGPRGFALLMISIVWSCWWSQPFNTGARCRSSGWSTATCGIRWRRGLPH